MISELKTAYEKAKLAYELELKRLAGEMLASGRKRVVLECGTKISLLKKKSKLASPELESLLNQLENERNRLSRINTEEIRKIQVDLIKSQAKLESLTGSSLTRELEIKIANLDLSNDYTIKVS